MVQITHCCLFLVLLCVVKCHERQNQLPLKVLSSDDDDSEAQLDAALEKFINLIPVSEKNLEPKILETMLGFIFGSISTIIGIGNGISSLTKATPVRCLSGSKSNR